MAIERPTFSESWHRVAELKPRLRAAVRNFRQYYRGRMWHVLADEANNQFFRLDEAAYRFVALLDGRRNVAEAWKISNEDMGDRAPTQGEAIQLLGQLYMANLLQADMPPDSQQMFGRYRRRVNREIGTYLQNFLFLRIPIFDPQPLLRSTVKLVGWVFSPIGFIVWCGLIGTALYYLTGHWGELFEAAQPQSLLKQENLLVLYFSFAIIKAIHELGHAYSCAHFGRIGGTGGAVHTIGIMLLIFMPVPYVDASSSWTFRNKWHRVIVGAAGMYVELAVASIAAIYWANTTQGTLTSDIAYNIIFIASVSTILFNANPLLRYDGYYMLSDTLEIANLAQRSRQYLLYLGKRYLFGVKRARSTAHSIGERWWLSFYGVTSFFYRVIVCVGILIYVSRVFFVIGVIMAFSSFCAWVLYPIGKLLKYLALGDELERVRLRAVATTTFLVTVAVVLIGVVPWPDRGRAEGVVQPIHFAQVYTGADGFLQSSLPSGTLVKPDGPPLFTATNKRLEADREMLIAQIKASEIERDKAYESQPELASAYEGKIGSLRAQLNVKEQRLKALNVHAPFEGQWVSRDAEKIAGVYLREGTPVGILADTSSLFVRVAADQVLGPLIDPLNTTAELRILGRPEIKFTGKIIKVVPSAQTELPSPALGLPAGGALQVALNDRTGTTALEPYFEVHVSLDPEMMKHLRTGQRVVARFQMPDKPLAVQWYRAALQLIQRPSTWSRPTLRSLASEPPR